MPKPKVFIFLHGYDSCGKDMMVLDTAFRKIAQEGSQFLFPDAPFPVNNGNGFCWFPFVFGDNPFDINEEFIFTSMQQALPYLKAYIDKNVDWSRFTKQDIILIGFSQGAGLALHTSMRLGEKICGVISFSGGLANPHNEVKHRLEQECKSPVCFIHGTDDAILPYQFSQRGHKMLKTAGFDTELHILQDTKHIITPEAMKVAEKFVKKIIK
jgi:phospholipase/carboxylesterase